MKVKICGVKTQRDISAVQQAQPDYIGVIHGADSQVEVKELTSCHQLLDDLGELGVWVTEASDIYIQRHLPLLLPAALQTYTPLSKEAFRVANRLGIDVWYAHRAGELPHDLDAYSLIIFDNTTVLPVPIAVAVAGGLGVGSHIDSQAIMADANRCCNTKAAKDQLKCREWVEYVRSL